MAAQIQNSDIDFGGVSRPVNVPNPALDGDAANKAYVDAASLTQDLYFTIAAGGAQSLTLNYPSRGKNSLAVNGLLQSILDYSVSGLTLTIPSGMLLMIGDKIIFTSNR